jgi:hypothetical protein
MYLAAWRSRTIKSLCWAKCAQHKDTQKKIIIFACSFFFKKCFECPSQHLLDNKVSSICPGKLSRLDHCVFR